MQAEFINPLVEASKLILSNTTQMNVRVGKIFVRTTPNNDGGVGICIGITGKIRGQVVFSMQTKVACKLASSLMMGPINELDEVSRSAVSELANMIMGTTASKLSESGFKIDITPPAFLLGENLSYLGTSKVKTLCIPFIMEDDSEIEAEVFVLKDE